MSKNEAPVSFQDIYNEIKDALLLSRNQAYHAVNTAMVQAYWQIGRIIVEHEQNGSLRAEYGKAVLQGLSSRLTEEFGKGFNLTNLKYMRQFYMTFPNGHALRGELTWTHHRALSKGNPAFAGTFWHGMRQRRRQPIRKERKT